MVVVVVMIKSLEMHFYWVLYFTLHVNVISMVDKNCIGNAKEDGMVLVISLEIGFTLSSIRMRIVCINVCIYMLYIKVGRKSGERKE